LRNRILVLLALCGLVASASAQSNFNRFNFTAGGGLGIGRGDVASFVGNSFHGVVGGGMNFNRIFGVDAEYMYYDLGFKQSVIQDQYLHGQSGRMQSLSLDGIVNVPRHYGKLGAYGIFGIGFYDRSVSVPHPISVSGSTGPKPAYTWWDLAWNSNGTAYALKQTMSSHSVVAGGCNYGIGITYRLNHFDNAKLYVEGRYHKAYTHDVANDTSGAGARDLKTIVMPITVGVRW
jgi:hypothetical protein